MWRGPYTHAGAMEAQPGTPTCIHVRKSQPAHGHPRMEKEAPGTWYIIHCEWVVGLELMSAGATA